MKNEVKFTMKEMQARLILAIGEAFARLAKEKTTNIMSRSVKMKDWFGTTEDDMVPEKLDYVTDEDFMYADFDYEGKYRITYHATDGLTFSVSDEVYFDLVDRFLDYFFAIYKA